METLQLDATKSSPRILFDPTTHHHVIEGESYPENTTAFYEPIMQWLEAYIESLGDQEAIIDIAIIYFNSSSSKALLDIFDLFDEACEEGKHIVVNWIYDEEDDASLEYGEEFAEDVESLTFNLVVKA
jgi:hypothetical protein